MNEESTSMQMATELDSSSPKDKKEKKAKKEKKDKDKDKKKKRKSKSDEVEFVVDTKPAEALPGVITDDESEASTAAKTVAKVSRKRARSEVKVEAESDEADSAKPADALESPVAKPAAKRPRTRSMDAAEAAAQVIHIQVRQDSPISLLESPVPYLLLTVIRSQVDAEATGTHPSIDDFNISEASKTQLRARGIETLFPIQVQGRHCNSSSQITSAQLRWPPFAM